MKRVITAAMALLGLATTAGACSSSTTASGTYTVAFQSLDEAVAADSLKVMVFDASTLDAQEACVHLMALRASNQDLPPAMTEVSSTSCALRNGGGSFTAPFGNIAVLVLAQTKGQTTDVARGCATQRFSADLTSITVEVSLVPGTQVTPTTCVSLSQHCGGGC